MLYYIPDEDLRGRGTVFAEFFGQPKATVAALGRLARRCDAEVMPCYSWYDREARRYRLRVEAPIQREWGEDADGDVAAMNAAIESLIRLCPEQYMWTLRLFKTRPPGEPYLYKLPLR